MNGSAEELDALRELINIGVGRGIRLNVPSVTVLQPKDTRWAAGGDAGRKLACVRLCFEGALRGSADLVFPSASGSQLVALLTGEDLEIPDLDSLRAGTLNEVGNILLNGFMGAITNFVGEHVRYELPIYVEETAEEIERNLRAMPDSAVLLAQAQFYVGPSGHGLGGERIDGEVTLLLGVESLERLLECVQQIAEGVLT